MFFWELGHGGSWCYAECGDGCRGFGSDAAGKWRTVGAGRGAEKSAVQQGVGRRARESAAAELVAAVGRGVSRWALRGDGECRVWDVRVALSAEPGGDGYADGEGDGFSRRPDRDDRQADAFLGTGLQRGRQARVREHGFADRSGGGWQGAYRQWHRGLQLPRGQDCAGEIDPDSVTKAGRWEADEADRRSGWRDGSAVSCGDCGGGTC